MPNITSLLQSCQPLRFSVLHFTPLRPYSEIYVKSAFSCNSSIWYSSDNILAAHCITRLVFRGLYRGCCSFSTASVLLTTQQLLQTICLESLCCTSEWKWCICSRRALNFVGLIYFTYAGELLFHTMFPDTDIANIFGSGPEMEKSVARTPGTCVFCLWASEQSKTLVRPSYCHFEARYAVVSSSFIVE